MENNLRVVLDNYIGSASFPCHLQIGASASIDLSKCREKNEAGMVKEKLTVTYTVDTKECVVEFTRYDVDEHGNAKSVRFLVCEQVCRYVRGHDFGITKTNYISITSSLTSFIAPVHSDWTQSRKSNRSIDAWGGVMETTAYFYRNGSRWDLFIIVESKKNGMEFKSEVVTLAHYFVKGSEKGLTDQLEQILAFLWW